MIAGGSLYELLCCFVFTLTIEIFSLRLSEAIEKRIVIIIYLIMMMTSMIILIMVTFIANVANVI